MVGESTAASPMREILVEKITLNMGIGEAGDELRKGEKILETISGAKPVHCQCKVKQPSWGIREGLPIGVKATLRGRKALDFLEKALTAVDKELKAKNFDRRGNFGFGIKEYINLPHVKYDPRLGIKGLDVAVTLERPGFRIKKRKLKKRKVGARHLISRDEAIDFVKKNFGVEIG